VDRIRNVEVDMHIILTRDRMSELESILEAELLENGADHVFIVDSSGNLIIERGKLPMGDILSLAALSAANFGATEQIARLIGEEDFSLLFHKGAKQNIHFSRIGKNFILVTLFGNDVSLGLIRLRSSKAIEKLLNILG
jgi:predicted regulator of Ras-like GTPase activity (Roadblock/LC7/MglB family)